MLIKSNILKLSKMEYMLGSYLPGASPQKFERGGQRREVSEAYEGASVKSGRAGTMGLMLKSHETWRCRRGYLPGSPRYGCNFGSHVGGAERSRYLGQP